MSTANESGVLIIQGHVHAQTSPALIMDPQTLMSGLRRGVRNMSESVVGAFGLVYFDPEQKTVAFGVDPVGSESLYYYETPDLLVVANSLGGIARQIEPAVDPVGVAQRLTPPHSNYGRTTILRGVSRLLPGEWRVVGPGSAKTWFVDEWVNQHELHSLDEARDLAWQTYREAVAASVPSSGMAILGTSGGWDSRILLAALVEHGRDVECWSYGSSELYEVRLAARCAAAVGAPHRSFPIEGTYFPTFERMRELARISENATHTVWDPLLRAAPNTGRPSFLLGDLAEALDGRNLKRLSSRQARRSSVLRSALRLPEDYPRLSRASEGSWAESTQEAIRSGLRTSFGRLGPACLGEVTIDEVIDQSEADIELDVQRVVRSGIQLADQLPEVWAWHHKVRDLTMGQTHVLRAGFDAGVPAMSSHFLGTVAGIQPRFRVRRRLIDAIARGCVSPALRAIPSAQIPMVGADAPTWMREGIWATRSGVDQLLTRRMMRKRNPLVRQRVLPFLDFVREYRRSETLGRVQSWFSQSPWVEGEAYIKLVERRAALEAWPLINVDITVSATISLLLDSILESKD